VACAVTDDPDALASIGVRDSKELSPHAREQLERDLKGRLTAFAVVVIEPADIDRVVAKKGLNGAEARAFAQAVGHAASSVGLGTIDTLEADAADANAPRFAARLRQELTVHAVGLHVKKLVAEHKADARFPSVGAASILAKVERDRRVKRLGDDIGSNVGSGYPHDPNTLAFLREYIRTKGDLPPFARRSWKTARTLLNEASGRNPTLGHFAAGAEFDE
jgi:ribonuclease HII